MKLIHILALITSMASVAVSQTANPPASDNKKPAVITSKPSASTAKTGAAPATAGPAKNTPQTKTGATSVKTGSAPAPAASKKSSPAQSGTTSKAGTKPSSPAQGISVAPASKNNTTKPATQTTAGNKPAQPKTAATPTSNVAAVSAAKKKPAGKTEAKSSGLKATTRSSTVSRSAGAASVQPLGGARGRRDPFVSPIRTSSTDQAGVLPTGPPCTVGKRCLSIPDMTVHGTVKDINGKMMAVVLTPSRRMYLLSENDQILNGTVLKITKEAVTFREVSRDKSGRESPHDVTKKIVPSS